MPRPPRVLLALLPYVFAAVAAVAGLGAASAVFAASPASLGGIATIALRGYGPGGIVFDHHEVVGVLLEPDLSALEAVLRTLPWWKRVGPPELVDAPRRFLGSELHVQILESVSSRGGGSVPAGAGRLVAANLASESFVTRATAAADRSFGKLQGAAIEQRAIAWFAGLALLLLTLRLAAFRDVADAPLFAGVAIAAIVAWVACEFETRARIRRLLGAALEKRVATRFAVVRSRHRWVAAGLSALAWGLAALPDLF